MNNQYWNKRFEEIIEQHWNGKYRTIPVFLVSLHNDILGLFQHCSSGANCILLNQDSGLSQDDMEKVFLHEICHHIVFEEYGPDVEEHGKEWQHEMEKVR